MVFALEVNIVLTLLHYMPADHVKDLNDTARDGKGKERGPKTLQVFEIVLVRQEFPAHQVRVYLRQCANKHQLA